MVVGLTGGIGSGKSTVLELFKNLGVTTYIADHEAKKLMNTDEELIADIKKLFGNRAYRQNRLNSELVGEVVFNDREKLAQLNALVHPKVKAHFKKFLRGRLQEIVIYEAAILFESGSHKNCDFIISVVTDLTARVERIIKRDSLTKDEILARISNQSTDEYKILRSHFVIKNNDLENTKEQVVTTFKLLEKTQIK